MRSEQIAHSASRILAYVLSVCVLRRGAPNEFLRWLAGPAFGNSVERLRGSLADLLRAIPTRAASLLAVSCI